jgi:RNA polymerase-binding transcription factor DksA
MSKTKARKAVKAAKATKPKRSKPRQAIMTAKTKASRTAAKKPPTLKARRLIKKQPQQVKKAIAAIPAELASTESTVITKTIKWAAAELKQFRDRLQKLHDIAVDDIGFLAGRRSAKPDDGVISRRDGDGQNTEEDGTDTFAQELSLMQASNKQDMLIQIIEAFQRLDQRTYGLCEECEGLIAEARLHAQPFATKCIKCQAAAEANRPRSPGFRKSMVQTVELEPA